MQGRGTRPECNREKRMEKLNYVGVDVSAKTVTMIIDQQGKRTDPLDLPNDARGHKKLIGMITKSRSHARVVLEATGVYSLDLSLALHRANRVEVMVANPRAINQFAEAYMRRSKTDFLDARILLEFAMRMDFKLWSPHELIVLLILNYGHNKIV